LATPSIRILVVDDYEPWRLFVSSTLQKQPELQIIEEAWDGLEAVQKAQELQPDLILLDIGLPSLNGIEVARRIPELSPRSKIIFVSENRSADIAREALGTGASGYVVKSEAAHELLVAIEAVIQGRKFVSAGLAAHGLNGPPNPQAAEHPHINNNRVVLMPRRPCHEAGFYSNDQQLLLAVTQFIGSALKSGNAAIVVATESHRNSLLARLQAYGLDIGGAIEQGRYIAMDAAETLSQFMLNDMPDSGRFVELLGDLVVMAMEATESIHPQVAIFGDCVNLLCMQGNAEAAIQLEKLGNQLTKIHNVGILCGYSVSALQDGTDGQLFQRICAEHSSVYCG
jgi:DNA-binding NarL/FixJ family response regulator